VGGWLWCNGKIGNKLKLGFDCFGGLVVEKARGMMESIDGGAGPITLCGLPLWRMIVAKTAWSLTPFFFWTQGIWGNLSCDGWFHFHDTCSMVACMCMGLSHDHSLSRVHPLTDDTGLTLAGKFSGFFLAEGSKILIPIL
jgi:hypothetical protein